MRNAKAITRLLVLLGLLLLVLALQDDRVGGVLADRFAALLSPTPAARPSSPAATPLPPLPPPPSPAATPAAPRITLAEPTEAALLARSRTLPLAARADLLLTAILRGSAAAATELERWIATELPAGSLDEELGRRLEALARRAPGPATRHAAAGLLLADAGRLVPPVDLPADPAPPATEVHLARLLGLWARRGAAPAATASWLAARTSMDRPLPLREASWQGLAALGEAGGLRLLAGLAEPQPVVAAGPLGEALLDLAIAWPDGRTSLIVAALDALATATPEDGRHGASLVLLRGLAGADHGDTPAAWRSWWEDDSRPAARPPDAARAGQLTPTPAAPSQGRRNSTTSGL